MSIVEDILDHRGIQGEYRHAFLNPDYDSQHDPFLLPDMELAVSRLIKAYERNEKITIYGDYDIDGLTATTILLDGLESFGFKDIDAFIPNRFVEGYGLTVDAVERIAKTGADLIITVDCGSLSEAEIVRANELGVDVIVTDHHNVAPVQPPAVAVINPKRLLQDYPDEYEGYILKKDSNYIDKIYPFVDLAGCGVAFKLIQALQSRMEGLDDGQEKWLLDLVALGTVCDVVNLIDENRINVYWGLKVIAKTRRLGLKSLMKVSGINPQDINAQHLGFALGPRMNASGRLETARYSLDMLRATNIQDALSSAEKLDDMNKARRLEQDRIFKEATLQAEEMKDSSVLVVSGKNWSHGIIGIVAAKLLEKYKKPTYVLEEMENGEAKGSARSYGDFSVADAIRASDDIITKGGGHKLAAGVTLPVGNIEKFRNRVNSFYDELKLVNQEELLLPNADIEANIDKIDEALIDSISKMEPFGSGNPRPVIKSKNLNVINKKQMGSDGQHLKLTLEDSGRSIQMIAFNAPRDYFVEIDATVDVWYHPIINEWRGAKNVEGRILHIVSK